MFTKIARRLVVFVKGDDGPTSVEYAIMLALIITVCVISVKFLGTTVSSKYSDPVLNTALTTGS